MSHLLKRSSRARTALVVCSLALAVLATSGQAFATGSSGEANGSYAVQVLSGGGWTTVGAVSFGLQYTTRAINLPGSYDSLRLVQSGGTAAQIDSAVLDGAAPVAVSGSSDAMAREKMRATDNDVTNAHDGAFVLTFPARGSRLEINARIQGDLSGAFPFEYPEANACRPVTLDSSFYSVRVGDLPAAIDTSAKPFIRVFSKPGTGHPNGYTYAWVAADSEHLLVTVDFTSDNTTDGDEDYATVHVKTPRAVKDFRVSAADRRWGDVAFTYTDKVSYQHKLYSFRIPLSELGAGSETVELAFTTYGTAAITLVPVYRFFNPTTGAHFYTASDEEKAKVIATLGTRFNYEGVAYSVNVSNPANSSPLHRFFNRSTSAHFYTASDTEKADVISHTDWPFDYEGVAYNVCTTNPPASQTVHRFRNKRTGTHFYTASETERAQVAATLGWLYDYEGIGFYLAP